MADSSESAGLAAAAAAFIVAIVEGMKFRARKKRAGEDDSIPTLNSGAQSHPVTALAAQVGSVQQRLHDIEAKMAKLEESIDGVAGEIEEFALKYTRTTTEQRIHLEHLQGLVKELRDQLKEKK